MIGRRVFVLLMNAELGAFTDTVVVSSVFKWEFVHGGGGGFRGGGAVLMLGSGFG